MKKSVPERWEILLPRDISHPLFLTKISTQSVTVQTYKIDLVAYDKEFDYVVYSGTFHCL